MTDTAVYAGVELGGTKCVCTLATADARIIDQSVIPTGSPAETISAIERQILNWTATHEVSGLGIASFGPVDLDPTSETYGFITTTAKPGWQRTDVAQRLARSTGLATAFDTDVNGAALAEMTWGAGAGLSDFAYITVGTGVGVGLIINGAPTRGFAHCELGHIRVARLPSDSWSGACPFHGECVEGLASGSALKARLGLRPIDSVEPSDPLWECVAWPLAQLCHVIVCTAAPQRIVLGGGVGEQQPHLVSMVEKMLRDSLAGYIVLPGSGSYIERPGLGSSAGQLGPIALALG